MKTLAAILVLLAIGCSASPSAPPPRAAAPISAPLPPMPPGSAGPPPSLRTDEASR